MILYSVPAMAIAAAGLVVTAAGGALVTQLGPWYYGLRQPSWKPPDWLFGPAWTTIFLFQAWAFVLAWEQLPQAWDRVWLMALFALTGGLNLLWSYLFFRRRRPDLALVEVFPFFGSIALLAVVTGRLDHRAGWAFAPYLVWVCFATALNIAIVRLNAPFTPR
jgi:translocator protein